MSAAVGVIAAFVLSTAAGVSLVAFAFGRASTTMEWLGRVALGATVGLGLTSLFAFGWLFVAGGTGPTYSLAGAAFCVSLLVVLLVAARTREALRPPKLERDEAIALAALLVGAAFAAWRFAAATQQMPHGEWDAWEVWNYRARHIFRAGPEWRSAFAVGIKSTEYPLLVPLSIVHAWAYGGESTLGPATVAGLFTIGGPLMVAGLVTRASTPIAGSAAGLLLFGTANYQWWGAQQYGDVPLATFVVAGAGILLSDSHRAPAHARGAAGLTVLGGFLLGLAGWTKTDGVLAAAVIALAAVCRARFRGGVALKLARRISVGAAVPALAWVAQHLLLSPDIAPVLTDGQDRVWAKVVDVGRWSTVLRWLWDHAPGQDVWLVFLVIGVAAVHGTRPRILLRSTALWCAAAMYLVVTLVFVVTPLDLEFHLLTAGDRLMLQPWPLFIYGMFAAVDASVAIPADQIGSPRRLGEP